MAKVVVKVEDALFTHLARQSALRRRITQGRDGLWKKFNEYRNEFRLNIHQKIDHLSEDLDAFIEAYCNLEIVEEKPSLRIENGRYCVDVEFTIEDNE